MAEKPNSYIGYDFLVGIDPGKSTGITLYDRTTKKIITCETMSIHRAMFKVLKLSRETKFLLYLEDARKRKWFGNNENGKKKQGAGSIKRDCIIWVDFLNDFKIDYVLLHPKDITTKIEPAYFGKLTGVTYRISKHARASAMMVYGK